LGAFFGEPKRVQFVSMSPGFSQWEIFGGFKQAPEISPKKIWGQSLRRFLRGGKKGFMGT